MNRFHVNITVTDVTKSVEFYSNLFGQSPSVIKPDYAKWMLDDPAVNFAIGTACDDISTGISHLGIQADSATGLQRIADRLKAANQTTVNQQAVTCCYAVSDKTWVQDPNGVNWETFYTHDTATEYGEDAARLELESALNTNKSCC
ncbi:MAG: VOC family protein [Robiginitomaculum sp.]|nr:VOC family protein [Robiginitomaculum sp.]